MEQFCANLDALKPALVVIDPLYAFHPPGIEAQNLYERGRMLAELSSLTADRAALMVADHFRKNNSAELDLDSIAQAGMSQWADSWVLQKHEKAPDLENGRYVLGVEFGSRQWGGRRWVVEWELPPGGVGEELGAGQISWTVRKPEASSARGEGSQNEEAHSADGRRRLILEFISQHPDLSKSRACQALGAEHRVGEKKFRAEWERLNAEKFIEEVEAQVPRKRSNGEVFHVKGRIWRRTSPRFQLGG